MKIISARIRIRIRENIPRIRNSDMNCSYCTNANMSCLYFTKANMSCSYSTGANMSSSHLTTANMGSSKKTSFFVCIINILRFCQNKKNRLVICKFSQNFYYLVFFWFDNFFILGFFDIKNHKKVVESKNVFFTKVVEDLHIRRRFFFILTKFQKWGL